MNKVNIITSFHVRDGRPVVQVRVQIPADSSGMLRPEWRAPQAKILDWNLTPCWGYYDEGGEYRYLTISSPASTWEDAQDWAEAQVHDVLMSLQPLSDCYGHLKATKPKDRVLEVESDGFAFVSTEDS